MRQLGNIFLALALCALAALISPAGAESSAPPQTVAAASPDAAATVPPTAEPSPTATAVLIAGETLQAQLAGYEQQLGKLGQQQAQLEKQRDQVKAQLEAVDKQLLLLRGARIGARIALGLGDDGR